VLLAALGREVAPSKSNASRLALRRAVVARYAARREDAWSIRRASEIFAHAMSTQKETLIEASVRQVPLDDRHSA